MSLILDGTNGETFPSWTTAGRPASPVVGQMGYNTTTGLFDQYTASGWVGSLTNASQSIPKSALPTGSVLQVVSFSTTTGTSTSSSTYVTSALTASITPTSSTTKILVILHANMGITGASNTCFGTLYRNSTNLGGGGYSSMIDIYSSTSTSLYSNQSIVYLDSPATTSSTAYALYLSAYSGSGTASVNPNASVATITLLEIAA